MAAALIGGLIAQRLRQPLLADDLVAILGNHEQRARFADVMRCEATEYEEVLDAALSDTGGGEQSTAVRMVDLVVKAPPA